MTEIPPILFYCKDCQRAFKSAKKMGNKYEYTCEACNSKKVVFGSSQAITDYFHIKETMLEKMLAQ